MNGIFIHQQIKALQDLGCECHVLQDYNWFPRGGLHKSHIYWKAGFDAFHNCLDLLEGVTIHKVPSFVKMPNRLFPENYYDRLARSFARYIQKSPILENADWIYAHFLTDFGYIGTKVKALTGIKLAAIARGDDVHAWPKENPKLIHHIEEVFDHADLIFANSQRLGQDANDLIAKKHQKQVHVIYNGVDIEKFRPPVKAEKKSLQEKFNLDASKNYILCVGTPLKEKGWLELLDAMLKLKSQIKNWNLLCVAINRESADALDLKEESKMRGLERYVSVIGQLSHDDLAELYRAVDAFVLPSYNEGMANALLEAAASNLKIIVSDVGGHSEIFMNSQDCSLIQPRNLNELVAALKKLINTDADIPVKTREKVMKLGTFLDNSKKLLAHFSKQQSLA